MTRYRVRHPEKVSHYSRQRKLCRYALTSEQYDALLTAQNGVCAICHKPERAKLNGTVKSLAIDHDHATGKVRGLLCQKCNRGIGQFNDDPKLLRGAADYLEEKDG